MASAKVPDWLNGFENPPAADKLDAGQVRTIGQQFIAGDLDQDEFDSAMGYAVPAIDAEVPAGDDA